MSRIWALRRKDYHKLYANGNVMNAPVLRDHGQNWYGEQEPNNMDYNQPSQTCCAATGNSAQVK
jgi:hypothetical protein